MGRDVFFYSITIDPGHDTPQVLKEYAQTFHAGPGWTFLTGNEKDIELISRKLGLYSEPNPANPDGHTPMLIIGNEATGQWMRNSATDNAKFLARTIGDWLNSWQTAATSPVSYADAPKLTFDAAAVSFRNHCAACHTIGRGDLVGPDLRGVVARRNRDWLARFIAAPDRVVASGDPIARALLVRYPQPLMPNLGLGPGDADLLIDYIDARSRVIDGEVASTPAASIGAAGGDASLAAIVDPYVRMQRALSADEVTGIDDAAAALSAAASALGADGAAIRLAADAMRRPSSLTATRGDFGRLGDAILIYARTARRALGDQVTIAYCPMAHRYWLQRGTTLQNPFFGKRMAACGRIAPAVPKLAN
jgi:protein SCO1/2